MRLRMPLSWLCVLLVAAQGACTSQREAAGQYKELPSEVSIHQQTLPITAAMEFSVAASESLNRAQQVLLQQCMVGHGFPLPIDPYAATTQPGRYGPTDLEQVRAFGYELPETLPDPPSTQFYATLTPERQEAYAVALFGRESERIQVPDSGGISIAAGCIGQARNTIFGGPDRALRAEELRLAVQRLESQSFDQATADQRVQTAIGEWSECMLAHGFDVPTPDDAVKAAAAGDVQGTDIAPIHVMCADLVNLVETWSMVEAAVQLRLFDDNKSMIREAVKLRADAVREARKLLDSVESLS